MSIQNSHQISEVKVMLTKGVDGNGIASIEKTGTEGLVDIYTITYTNGEKTTFTVTNGAGGGMSALLLITSDAGSEVTVTTPSGRVITAEQVSGSSTQWQAETTEYGVHTIDAVLAGSDAQVTQNVDACKIYLIDDSHFSASITVKYPDGYTCRCQGTSESSYATGSPFTFSVHSADTYTITVTDGTDTYTATVVITTDGQTESLTCPAPADVPANDLDWWLWFGDVEGTYSTLADVLADANALSDLMSSTEAVDYLVRCTSWISDITGNQSAMSYIGLNNYASNTLIADSTWNTAIQNSTYFESVDNAKVPVMTSNTTPSGEASASSEMDVYKQAWKAFDQTNDTYWQPTYAGSVDPYLQYQFTEPVKLKKATLKMGTNPQGGTPMTLTAVVQGSNDNATYTDISSAVTISGANPSDHEIILNNNSNYEYARVQFTGNMVERANIDRRVIECQFYGRVDV